MASIQILDTTIIKHYRDSLGEDVIKGLIYAYIDDIENRLKEIIRFQSENHYDQIGREGHSIKGASSNLGLLRMTSLGQDIQLAAEANDHDKVDLLINELKGETDLAVAELKKMVKI